MKEQRIELLVDRIIKDKDGNEVEHKAGSVIIMDKARAEDYVKYNIGKAVAKKKAEKEDEQL